MLNVRRNRFVALALAASFTAAAASSAHAAFSYNITADNSTQQSISPTFVITNSNPGPLYGAPVVSGNVTLDFSASLSPNFLATADHITNIQQTTDGHLVISLHFDTPISITAQILEGGTFATTGDGIVSVTGGEVAIEAINLVPVETHSASLLPTFGANTWAASATTSPFIGSYTDYQISIDNNLLAQAVTGSATIQKTSFTILITPEPTSLSLLALGAGGLLLRRRRKLA